MYVRISTIMIRLFEKLLKSITAIYVQLIEEK